MREAFAIGLGLVCLLASLFTAPGQATVALRVAGAFALLVGYGVSVAIRMVDHDHGWERGDAAALLPVLFLWRVVRLA